MTSEGNITTHRTNTHMEMEFENRKIRLKRVLSVLDRFVIDFVQILDHLEIKYVIISSYLPLLFGRQRITEDVDIFLEDIDGIKLRRLYNVLSKKYWFLNAESFERFSALWNEKIAPRAGTKRRNLTKHGNKEIENRSGPGFDGKCHRG